MERLGCAKSRKFAKGMASAYSFQCSSAVFSPERLERMIGEVEDVIDRDRDSVMVYRFPGRIGVARLRVGRKQEDLLGEPWLF